MKCLKSVVKKTKVWTFDVLLNIKSSRLYCETLLKYLLQPTWWNIVFLKLICL